MPATFKSNSAAINEKLGTAIKRALLQIGGIAETAAKERCPVDTGLLQNSITYAIGGEAPHITHYKSNPKTGQEQQQGSYTGTAPKDDKGEYSVYVGTNVQYAPYQELGTVKMPNGNPYIRPAVEANMAVFQRMLKDELGSVAK